MSFFVYENWTRDRARLHRGSCGYCNEGQGTQPIDSGSNGKWHGPFENIETARRALRNVKKSDSKECGCCSL